MKTIIHYPCPWSLVSRRVYICLSWVQLRWPKLSYSQLLNLLSWFKLNLANHTYPELYLGKKKCPWEMTLITFFKCYVSNLNPEFEKILSRDFWKNAIWSFLPYKAQSELRAKSVKRAPYKAADCPKDPEIWFPI